MKTKTTHVKLLHLILILFFLTVSNSIFSQLLFQSSFEGSNPFAGWSNSQSCCSYSVTAPTTHPHDGNQAFRSEVRTNDPSVSSGYRAELTLPNISDQGDMWYGWSMYFEGNNSAGTGWTGQYGVTTQWHPNNGTGSAELAIYADGGKFDITVNPSGGAGGTHQTSGMQSIIANRWYDIVFHVNWASSGGSVEVWIDGQPYFSKTNLSWAQGAYLKMGMNRWLMTNTWVVFYDNVKIGRNVTYNDVAPSASAPGNQAPTANAGADKTITLPIIATTLNGSGTDPDGTITNYSWSRVSGPTTFTLANATSALASLTGLIQGTYTFRLTVTDNNGATDTDDMTVTVNPLLNLAPTANAGSDITMTLPANSATLTGSGTDLDGSIASYAWSRVSGPTTFTLGSANAASTALTNLVQGIYVFRLTVTDNGGATATDNVTVTVNAAPQPPTANAGANITLTLPVNSTTLTGSGSDPDGTVAGYAWSRVSGPTTFTLGNANASTTALSNLVQGTYVFRLTVTDNSGMTGTDDITITVNPAANQAPAANAGNNITLTLPTNSTSLTGSGADADGTIASYAWTRVSGPTTFTFGSANAAITTLSNLVQGVYTFRLTVTDNSGATGTDDVTVTVNAAANQLPTANAGNNIVMTLPVNSTSLTGSGSDADGTITSYAWTRVSGPTTFTLGSANAASTTLSNLVQGNYVFRLTVTDNSGATGTDDVNVTVNTGTSTNQAPIANAGVNIVISLPTNSTTLNGSNSMDLDGTIASYAWSYISGPATYTITNATAATTTLTGLVQGTYVFRLTVTDNGGATDIDNIVVTVNAAANQVPAANAGNNIIITLPVNSTTLAGSGSDIDGTIASYAWSRVSGPTTFTLGNANAASTALSNLVQGTYVFRLTVTDNSGAAGTDDITVTVNPAPIPNQGPVAHAGNDIVMTLPTNSATLNGNTSTDTDGTIVSYSWSRVSGPTTYTFTSAGSAATGLNNLVQGVYVFRLTVTDDDGASATDDITVTVNAAINQVPVVNAGSDITITLPVNSTTLSGTASDPDGTIGSYAWSRVSGPTTFTLTNAASVTTNLTGLVQGTYVFRLLVTDNSGATAFDNVTVTVNATIPGNTPPTANAGADITITLPTNSTSLIGSGSDPGGTVVSYSWSRVSGPTTYILTNATSASTGLTNLVLGTYQFRLTVTDNFGATGSDIVVVNVVASTSGNQAPTARTNDDILLTLPINFTSLNGTTSTDADGIITAYAWTQLAGPSVAIITNGLTANSQVTGLTIGEYIFQLKVTDDDGATSIKTVKVTVKNKNGDGLYFNIYPNPTPGNLTFQFFENGNGKLKVSVFDATRRLLSNEMVDKTQVTLVQTMDVTKLKNGVYILQIILPDGRTVAKQFIKM
jgi:ribosomal protein L14